jgi:hypothetical protein
MQGSFLWMDGSNLCKRGKSSWTIANMIGAPLPVGGQDRPVLFLVKKIVALEAARIVRLPRLDPFRGPRTS